MTGNERNYRTVGQTRSACLSDGGKLTSEERGATTLRSVTIVRPLRSVKCVGRNDVSSGITQTTIYHC